MLFVKKMIDIQWNFKENIGNFVVSTVPADCLIEAVSGSVPVNRILH